MSCLGCQHFISDWLGKLKPNKLSTGCQNELKGAAVEKAMNPGRRFLFFSRLRRSCARLDKTAMLRRLPAMELLHAVFTSEASFERNGRLIMSEQAISVRLSYPLCRMSSFVRFYAL